MVKVERTYFACRGPGVPPLCSWLVSQCWIINDQNRVRRIESAKEENSGKAGGSNASDKVLDIQTLWLCRWVDVFAIWSLAQRRVQRLMFNAQLPVVYKQTYTYTRVPKGPFENLNCETECKRRAANGYTQGHSKNSRITISSGSPCHNPRNCPFHVLNLESFHLQR